MTAAVRRVYSCERCRHDGSVAKLYVMGSGQRLCLHCIRVLRRLSDVTPDAKVRGWWQS